MDTIIVLILLFVIFVILAGVAVGIYFFYRWYTDAPDSSILFKPGDMISFRPAFGSTIIGDFDKNTSLYTVSGPRIDSVETCPLDDVGSGSPETIPCNQTVWLYDKDKSLRPANDTSTYIYDYSNLPGLCPRENLKLGDSSDGPPLIWDFDRKRATWCVTEGKYKGKCMQTPGYGPFLNGITLNDLPTNFDSLNSSDFNRVSFQWVVTRPLTASSNPPCKG